MKDAFVKRTFSQLEEEAAEWLVKLDSDDGLSKREKRELSEWLSRSPAHAQELKSLVAVWQDNILPELLAQSASSQHKKEQPKAVNKGYWKGQSWLPTAAAFAYVLMLSLTFFFGEQQVTPADELFYATNTGEVREITLADNSTVVLNTDSQIKVKFDQYKRRISLLKGEAHFSVAKNKQRPFEVIANGGLVRAIGTAFTVSVAPERLNVLVTEGTVSLTKHDVMEQDKDANQIEEISLTQLTANQFLSLDMQQSSQLLIASVQDLIEQKTDDQISDIQAWKSGEIVFTGQSLQTAVNEINRYSSVKLKIIDNELKNLKIGGRFKTSKLDDFLIALENNFNIRVSKRDLQHIELRIR